MFIPEDYEPEAESCLRTDLGSGILCVLLRFCGMVILHKMEAAKWMGFSPGSFPSISKVDDFEALLLLPNPSSLPQGFFCSLLCPAGLLQGKSKTRQNQGKVGISFNDRLLLHRQKPSPSWGELRTASSSLLVTNEILNLVVSSAEAGNRSIGSKVTRLFGCFLPISIGSPPAHTFKLSSSLF